MIGTFANPQEDGAMGIPTSREAAEEFRPERPVRPAWRRAALVPKARRSPDSDGRAELRPDE